MVLHVFFTCCVFYNTKIYAKIPVEIDTDIFTSSGFTFTTTET
jgi:hypothetical protein